MIPRGVARWFVFCISAIVMVYIVLSVLRGVVWDAWELCIGVHFAGHRLWAEGPFTAEFEPWSLCIVYSL